MIDLGRNFCKMIHRGTYRRFGAWAYSIVKISKADGSGLPSSHSDAVDFGIKKC